MGNRAVITTGKQEDEIGVYLHWNGGRDSVQAFLRYCKMRGFRPPETDCYGWARLVQTIANFFGGDGLSIGIEKRGNLDCDNWDNGVYIIKDWEIVGREFFDSKEQDNYPLYDMLIAIDKAQPAKDRLGEKKIRAEIGDDAIKEARRAAARKQIETIYLKSIKNWNPYTDNATYDKMEKIARKAGILREIRKQYKIPARREK